jgi:hypothetical protein
MDNKISKIELIDSESLLKIRNLVIGNKSNGILNLDQLKLANPTISTFQSEVQLNLDVALAKTTGISLSEDITNVKLVREALPGLETAVATDERLWVTLALNQFHDYSVHRWYNGQPKPYQENYFRNHVLAAGVRDRWRNQSISRLWWVGHYASQLGQDVFDATLELFFYNSDLGSQLLGKPSIGSSREIARAIVMVVHDELLGSKTSTWDRNKFRTFMKRMDLLTGRRVLETVPSAKLQGEVRTLFRSIHK